MPSDRVKRNAIKMLGQALSKEEGNLLRRVTVKAGDEELNLPKKMRVGRPRVSWVITTASEAWRKWRKEEDKMEFDHLSEGMVARLVQLAKEKHQPVDE